MIDWLAFFLNTLWVLGLTIILAAVSYYHWHADQGKKSLRSFLASSSFSIVFSIGIFFFCVGVAGLSRTWWEQVLWGILAVVFAYQGWQQRVSAKSNKSQIEMGEADGAS